MNSSVENTGIGYLREGATMTRFQTIACLRIIFRPVGFFSCHHIESVGHG